MNKNVFSLISKDITNKIAIGDEYSLNLEYPTFLQVANMDYDENKTTTAASDIFDTALLCLHSLDTEDEKVHFKDEPKKDTEEFMGSLTAKQFESILNWVKRESRFKSLDEDGVYKYFLPIISRKKVDVPVSNLTEFLH
mgnify:CR=1 FL=1